MLLSWFIIHHALAAEPVPVEPVVPDQAEYARLTQELESLAGRNAWAGAERTFKKLEATGWPPSYADWMFGAHAARAIGDIANTRARLLAAKGIQEDKDVFDSLWSLDQNYASVNLHCDEGSGWELAAKERPFDPDLVRAMEFAIHAIASDCVFKGYLPKGDYVFAERSFTVLPGVTTIDMDMRGLQAPKKRKRSKKKDEPAPL